MKNYNAFMSNRNFAIIFLNYVVVMMIDLPIGMCNKNRIRYRKNGPKKDLDDRKNLTVHKPISC